MSGVIRQYQLQPGDAFDRRRMRELFFEAANRLNEVREDAIGDNQLTRTKYQSHTFEEYWYRAEVGVNYMIPHHAHQVPGSDLEIKQDDSFTFGEIAWSVEAIPISASCYYLTAWPVFDGKTLWSGESFAMYTSEFDLFSVSPVVDPWNEATAGTPFVVDRPVSFGSKTNIVGFNGRSLTGVLCTGIGQWKITSANMTVRTLAR